MWLWFLAGAVSFAILLVVIYVISFQVARFWKVTEIEKHVKRRGEILDDREKLLKESEGLLNDRWEKVKVAEKTFIKDKETERKKLDGFAKAVEARAQELGYIGRETWQDEEFNDHFGEDDADPEPT
jgi:biopolymer transport protein ExbB/TolQ